MVGVGFGEFGVNTSSTKRGRPRIGQILPIPAVRMGHECYAAGVSLPTPMRRPPMPENVSLPSIYHAVMDARLPEAERRERTRLALEGLKRLEQALVPYGFEGPFDESGDTPRAI